MSTETTILDPDGIQVTVDDSFNINGTPVVVPLPGAHVGVPGGNDDDLPPAARTWLGTTAAAEYLGINARTIYRLIDLGDLVAFKIGRVLRIKQADLDAYLERVRVQPGTISHLYPEGNGGADE